MKKKLIALLTACMFALCTVTSALALDKVSLPATSTATAAPAQSKRIEKKCGTSKSMVTSLLSSKSGGSGLHAAPSAISSYNEHDVALMRAFLEITDSKGVKNGQKIPMLIMMRTILQHGQILTGRRTVNLLTFVFGQSTSLSIQSTPLPAWSIPHQVKCCLSEILT